MRLNRVIVNYILTFIVSYKSTLYYDIDYKQSSIQHIINYTTKKDNLGTRGWRLRQAKGGPDSQPQDTFSLIWGQVTSTLRHNIQSLNSFVQMNVDYNSILLFTMLQTIVIKENEFEYKRSGFYKIMKRIYNLKQERHTTNADYLDKFQKMLKIVQIIGWDLGNELSLVKASLSTIFLCQINSWAIWLTFASSTKWFWRQYIFRERGSKWFFYFNALCRYSSWFQ